MRYLLALGAILFSLAGCTQPTTNNNDDPVEVSVKTDEIDTLATEARLGTITNQTYRSNTDIIVLVRSGIIDGFANYPQYDLDWLPQNWDPTTTPSALRMLPTVKAFDYSNGNLRVKVDMAIFRHSSMALLGNVSKTITKQGVSFPDTASEDQLVELAAKLAAESLCQNMSAF